MHLSTKQKKYLRYGVTTLLLAGIVSVTGFLSFAGMLALNDSIYLAMAGFFLAGVIEGEVYAQYIYKSLLKLFTRQYLEDQIYSALLEKLIDEHPESPFLKDYAKLVDRIHTLESAHDHAHKVELETAQKSLKWMKRDFARFMRNEASAEQDSLHDELSTLVSPETKDAIAKDIAKKRRRNRWSWILNIGAGISCGLVGLEAAQSSIAALTSHFGLAISGAALSASIFSIAFIAAIAYTLLIHHTISQMIQDETYTKWKNKVLHFFSQRPQNLKDGLKFAGKALGISIIISLSIFATLATAGTWWHAAKIGAKMIPGIKAIASEIRTVAVVIMSITSLLFNLTRSLESIKKLGHRLAHLPSELRKMKNNTEKKFQEYKAAENTRQRYNPFRLINKAISIPFKTISFLLHLLSMAVMSIRIKGVPTGLVTTTNVANEFVVDQDIIFPHCHEHQESDHEHKVEDRNRPLPRQKHEAHDHSHADLTGKFLKYIALAPLHFLEAAWDYRASQSNTGKKKPLTFKAALKKAFSGLPKEPQALPPLALSPETLQREKRNRIQRAKNKIAADDTKEAGMRIIEELEKQIIPTSPQAKATYVNCDGSINASSFYSGKRLDKSSRQVCDKFIKIANSSQYRISAR